MWGPYSLNLIVIPFFGVGTGEMGMEMGMRK